MSADVGLRFNGWSYSDLPYNGHNAQDSSVHQMVVDHGSVSFGRFAAESLSWEKRSVFEHNRRKEELSRLTAPGLVAQKKAFFEEYYKARHLKAQGGLHQTGAAMEENDDSTLCHSSQANEVPAAMSEDPVASAPSSTSFEPSTEVASSSESKCQDAHDLGYLTFNPLFCQTACLPNIKEEERSSSGQKLGSRIVLASLKFDPEKSGASENVPIINRSRKESKDLPTSVINIPRVDLRKNSENRPSRDLKDPFHKRVEMKLRALSDRMDADRTAASTRSSSYQPPERAMTSSRSAYQERLAMSSRSSVCQNTSRALAPSKLAAQASQKFIKGVQGSDAEPHGIFVNRGSSAYLVASRNSTATRKSPGKILVVPSSNQVCAKTSRTTQVTLKLSAVPTSINKVSQNKRKYTLAALDKKYPKREYVHKSAPPSARSSSENLPRAAKAPKISNVTNVVSEVTLKLSAVPTSMNKLSQNKRRYTLAPLDEKYPKREYVRRSARPSARSSSENLPHAAKAPKISNVTNVVSKTEVVQKSRSSKSSNPVGGRNMLTKRSENCSEENRKVIRSHAKNLSESSMRSNLKGSRTLTKNNQRQERPRWR